MKPATMKAIEEHALEEFPRECCGLVIAEGRKEVYIRCRNVADPGVAEDEFVIAPRDWKAAEQRGPVLAVAHSHPNASPHPSAADRRACNALGVPWAIVAVHADPATPEAPAFIAGNVILTPENHEVPLRGREFIFGVQDCYTLVQDFYKREMGGIVLPDFDRTDEFWKRGEDLYMDNFTGAGFDPIPYPTQKGDLILMAIRSDITNHAGIWLGEGDAMLHHPYNHLSERTVFGGFWLDNTRLYVRKMR